VAQYAGRQGFVDEGERAMFSHIEQLVRGQPILDLGVGAGRTVPLLRPLASSYIALDYTPAMVAACRRRFPAVDVRLGDARDLSAFADESFALVAFSYNGIDAIDHHGRQRVLEEAQRVLQRGGWFWFSTLNMDGGARSFSPWWPEWPEPDGQRLRFAARSLRALARVPRLVRNRARIEAQFSYGDGWCIETLAAHGYRLLMHYTTLECARRELADAGFRADPLVLDCATGKRVGPGEERDPFWFQILARK
jgi:ubiquinone/menaquinone biosynthesis C-methylase UbiE